MRYFVNPITKGLMIDALHGEHIPANAPEISAQQYASFMSQEIDIGTDGVPFIVTAKQPSVAEMLEAAKDALRSPRQKMLDALSGIAGRAERAGNTSLALESDALAEQLLDITDDAALNAATTYEEMQAAGVAAYKRIAATAGAELAVVFKEITGV